MRALIGTALTPAFPMSGFSFLPFGRKRFISFTKRIPLAEAMMNAKSTEGEDLDGVQGQELRCLGRAAHGKSEQHHHDIIQAAACRLGKSGGLSTFLQEISEEEHTEQWQTGWHDEGGEQQTDDREENLLGL